MPTNHHHHLETRRPLGWRHRQRRSRRRSSWTTINQWAVKQDTMIRCLANRTMVETGSGPSSWATLLLQLPTYSLWTYSLWTSKEVNLFLGEKKFHTLSLNQSESWLIKSLETVPKDWFSRVQPFPVVTVLIVKTSRPGRAAAGARARYWGRGRSRKASDKAGKWWGGWREHRHAPWPICQQTR